MPSQPHTARLRVNYVPRVMMGSGERVSNPSLSAFVYIHASIYACMCARTINIKVYRHSLTTLYASFIYHLVLESEWRASFPTRIEPVNYFFNLVCRIKSSDQQRRMLPGAPAGFDTNFC